MFDVPLALHEGDMVTPVGPSFKHSAIGGQVEFLNALIDDPAAIDTFHLKRGYIRIMGFVHKHYSFAASTKHQFMHVDRTSLRRRTNGSNNVVRIVYSHSMSLGVVAARVWSHYGRQIESVVELPRSEVLRVLISIHAGSATDTILRSISDEAFLRFRTSY